MAQPGVARLESGEHTPTLETLQRLSGVLGTGFTVGVGPRGSLELREKAEGGRLRKSAREVTTKPAAHITRVVVTCDLEDRDVTAAESLSFSYGGKTYTLDLCQKHLDEVKGALEGFAAAGHSAGRGARAGRHRGAAPAGRTTRASRPAATLRGESEAEIREWARAQGYAVGDRGRIPGEVRAAYESAQTKG
jgi:transcriptional regulator with XRE-family HTH domain